MARKPLRPLIRSGGFYPSRKWTPLVYAGGYTTANGGEEPTPPPIEKTVTGNPIHITDALAKPVQALSVALEPIQDLHGYDNPWPAGGGKNLFDASTVTGSSATVTVSSNGKRIDIAASSGNYNCAEFDATSLVGKGDFYLSYYAERTSGSENAASCTGNYRLNGAYKYDGVSGNRAYVNDKVQVTDAVVNFPEGATNAVIKFYINNYSTLPTGGISGYFEDVRLCKEQSQPWAPYSNLCPISGFTGLNVYGTGKNMIDDGYSSLYTNVVFLPVGTYYLQAFVTESPSQHTTKPQVYVNGSWVNVTPPYSADDGAISITGSDFGWLWSDTTQTITITKGGYFIRCNRNDNAMQTRRLSLSTEQLTDFAEYVGTTLPVSWQSEAGTVYGGTLDVVTGVLTIYGVFFETTWGSVPGGTILGSCTRKTFTSSPLSKYPSYTKTPICNVTSYFANFNSDTVHFYVNASSSNNVIVFLPNDTDDGTVIQVVYELATPITIQLTPQQVELLQGENNIWSDGTMTLVYLADGNASDVEALNILLGGRYVNNHTEDEPTDREALDILLGR